MAWLPAALCDRGAVPLDAATAPSGSILLQRATAATLARGSFHEVYRSEQRDSAGGIDVTREVGDVSFRHRILRLTVSEQLSEMRHGRRQMVFSATQQVVAVGDHGARMPQSGFWVCAGGFRVAAQAPPALIALRSDQIGAVLNLGAATAGGQPVWQVRVTGTRQAGTQREPYVAFELVSRRDGTLRREVFHSRFQRGRVRVDQSTTIDYSAYGEAVHAGLPAHCQEP